MIIDAQVHAYERNHPGRPWAGTLPGPQEVTGDQLIAAMDEVGVERALLVSPFSMYRYDPQYALDVQRGHPSRIRVIRAVDVADPGVGEVVAAWAATPGTAAVRVGFMPGGPEDAEDPGLSLALTAAAACDMPVNVMCWGHLDDAARLAEQHPHTQIVIDHLGLAQPARPPGVSDGFRDLPAVLDLAQLPNVAIKLTGVCTLSSETFPFDDIWPSLERVFEAYGLDRCMWGTDWTRTIGLLTYQQGVDAFRTTDRLSDSDRVKLMAGTLQRVYRWDD